MEYIYIYIIETYILQVAAEYAGKGYEDFAVVLQPGIRDGTPDDVPLDIVSTVRVLHVPVSI